MIKICKECGKEFEAKSARQQYCSGPHFRPCPVCGTPVEIKYLSDPTPKCAECRKHKTISVPEPAPTAKVKKPVEESIEMNVTVPVEKIEPKVTNESEVETVDNSSQVVDNSIDTSDNSETTQEIEIPDDVIAPKEDAKKDDAILGKYVTRKYVGRSSAGFQTDHIYTLCITENPPYGYSVHAIHDQTEEDDIDKYFLLSSMNSWRYFFKEV